jgi:hypothetical protein
LIKGRINGIPLGGKKFFLPNTAIYCSPPFFFFGSAAVWTQGLILPLEPHPQTFFFFFFWSWFTQGPALSRQARYRLSHSAFPEVILILRNN